MINFKFLKEEEEINFNKSKKVNNHKINKVKANHL